MQKAHDASKNSYWENLPSVATPIIAEELNRNETSVDVIDDRVVTFDTTKANQTDMLLAFKAVSFNSTTGKFIFTKFNDTTIEIDTDIEKIAINFDFDDDPTSPHYQQLVIQLDDGTYKYVDLSALITQYEFTDSAQIHFAVNNGSVTATIINGSITEEKLQPNFLADCRAAKTAAELAETNAKASEDEANAWANGEIDGVPVPPTHPAYQNNAKYYKDLANPTSLMALTDTDINYPTDKQALVYDKASEKWKNQDVFITSEEQTTNDTFETLNGGKLDSCVVKLEPVQDLHGQSYPWVGGAGKNKLPKGENTTSLDITYTVDDLGVITANGTSSNTSFGKGGIFTLPAGNYILTGCPTNSDDIRMDIRDGYAGTGIVTGTDTGSGLSFTLTEETTGYVNIRIPTGVTVTNMKFYPMIRLASVSDATFEPYENICPITPHTQSQVLREGKNQVKSTLGTATQSGLTYTPLGDGTYNINGTSSSNGGADFATNITLPAGTYKITGLPNDVASEDCYIALVSNGLYAYTSKRDSFTLLETTTFDSLRFRPNKNNQLNNVVVKPMITRDLSATYDDYEPYQSTLYTIQLGQNVYSAYIDFISGEMKIVGKYVELDGSETWNESGTSGYIITAGNSGILDCKYASSANTWCLSNLFKRSGATWSNGCFGIENRTIWISDTNQATFGGLANFKAMLSNSPLTIIYELATPLIVQLTPTQITALLGINNISAPLTKQSIYEAKYQELSAFNAVIDDNNESTETTYSSSKIEEKFASAEDTIPQTATNNFKTINGGLLDKLNVAFTPIQDLHGYSKPWAGGAGKNLIPMTVADLKTLNTSGTWSDNRYTFANGAIIDVLTDTDGNVIGIKGSGTHNAGASFNFNLGSVDFALGVTYTLNGITDGSNSTYRINVQGISNYTSGENTIAGDGSTHVVRINIQAGYSPMDFTVYPMIRLATIADPTFEPYSNICPISGHTQVQSKINNTTYTTSLGSTYYGGDVEQVGGTGEQIYDIVDLGNLNWSYESSWGAGADFYTSGLVSLAKLPLTDNDKGNIICTQYENKSRNDFYNSAESAVTLLKGGVLKIRDSRYSDTATFKTAMAGVKLVYELATPTALTLTGQNITAEVGVNNVSAPLTGQSIDVDGIEYKELFPFDDVMRVADSIQAEIDKVSYSGSVSCLVDDITCIITDANIKTTSLIEPFSSNSSGDTIVVKNMAITNGQAVLTFDALVEATSFMLRITNR